MSIDLAQLPKGMSVDTWYAIFKLGVLLLEDENGLHWEAATPAAA